MKTFNKSLMIFLLCIATVFSCASCGLYNVASEDEDEEKMIEQSKTSIAPYLEYLPTSLNEDGKIELTSEINSNKNDVFFLGMNGQVSYYTGKYGKTVTKMMWASHDFYTYEEDKDIADKLTDYFGSAPVVENEHYGQYNDTTYYWTDKSVPCTVILYTSVRANYEDEKDRIEIYWDMEQDIPD